MANTLTRIRLGKFDRLDDAISPNYACQSSISLSYTNILVTKIFFCQIDCTKFYTCQTFTLITMIFTIQCAIYLQYVQYMWMYTHASRIHQYNYEYMCIPIMFVILFDLFTDEKNYIPYVTNDIFIRLKIFL